MCVKATLRESLFWVVRSVCTVMALVPVMSIAEAQDQAADLAKQLSNPVAALISVPFQLNYDGRIGPGRDGERWLLNIQPVVPVSLSDDWNVISRTILPVVSQSDVFPDAGHQRGIGDVVQSFFFSPTKPAPGGWIWGAGPVLLLPTASNDLLGSEKWGAGPTAVLLRQAGPWSYGALVNHLWSFAGDDDRRNLNATFAQPFLTYNTPNAWTFSLNVESTYDWTAGQWSVPINLNASRVLAIGRQMLSIGGGVRYWADGPDSGPHDVGVRLTMTLLYPR